MRGVTYNQLKAQVDALISTRTPHAGSDENYDAEGFAVIISTRTPHAGSD